MRYLRRQAGFTIVEIVTVVAIGSLLLAGILVSTDGLQKRTAFTSAIDGVRIQIKEIQSEAFQSVAARPSNLAGTSDQTNFGKLIEFDNSTPAAATQMKTWTLVEDAAKTTLYKCDEQDSTLAQQVSFQNATNGAGPASNTEAIIFGRDPNQTYVDPNFTDPQAADVPECHPTASAAPVVVAPTICAGFTRTQSNPAGSCPIPPPPPRPPSACDADPTQYVCGLYGQYFTGAISDPTRTLDSAYIDQGIGAAPAAVQSYPSFLPVLANRTITPPANVSVNWSGAILIGANDSPSLVSHTYCFRDSYIGAMTIDGKAASGTPTQQCVTINPSDLAAGAGWYPIQIDYQTLTGSSPSAWLYEQTAGGPVEVPGGPGGDLRTQASNPLISPSNAFVNGLYGEYYGDTVLGSRISAYTDPVVGDGGIKFSYDGSNGLNDNNPNVWVPLLRNRTASNDGSGKSVRWTGQILVDTAGVQQYCTDADDTASITIEGTRVEGDFGGGGHPTQRICGSINLSAGWHNIEIDYNNTCCSSTFNGAYAEVRLVQLNPSSSQFVEVPHDHLRRPLDWSATGNQGSCGGRTTDCTRQGSLIQEFSSSTGSANCGGSNQQGLFTFSKTGLVPDSTYKMDITYQNVRGNENLPVPPGYSYQVCVSVNGVTANGGRPIVLPISEPSLDDRTYTLSGITVPASGNVTISLDWINDSWQPYSTDANFAIARLDLYRTLDAAGVLSAAPPAPATFTASTRQTLAARLLGLLLPAANAAGVCDTNVLNPNNYTPGCFQTISTATLNMQVTGEAEAGYIDISTQDNSIERRTTN